MTALNGINFASKCQVFDTKINLEGIINCVRKHFLICADTFKNQSDEVLWQSQG